MSRSLMAHESAVASAKMFFQMLIIALVISMSGQILLTWMYISPEINKVKKRKIPFSRLYISNLTLLKYCSGISFGLTEYTVLPEEFVPLFKKNRKLAVYIKPGNRVKREVFEKFLNIMYEGFFNRFPGILKKSLKRSSKVYLFVFLYMGYFFFRSKNLKNDKYLRGTVILSGHEMGKRLKEDCEKENVFEGWRMNYDVSGMVIPREAEQKHFLLLGSTGTGKTVLLNQIIGQSVKRQEKISTPERSIIYDIKGELLSKHYRPETDRIFYPFDKRSVGWNFMNEVRSYADFDVLSTSLFEPPKDSKDSYWYNAARDIFRAGLYYLFWKHSEKKNNRKVKNSEIWDFFTLPLGKINKILSEHLPVREKGALKHIESVDSPQASSVISVLQERISFFKYIYDIEGDFSFRDFISGDGNGNIFLMNIKQNDSIFKPLITFVIDIMIRETLSLRDIVKPDERRINFFIDEFGSLGRMTSVFDFLTMARAKGGALFVANQDLGSVSDIYGRDKKETFFNNFNTNFIFMLNDPATAEFLSRAFGEQELIQKSGDRQISPNSLGDTYTHREQYKINKVILPSQFICLKPFSCYFKYSGVGFVKLEIEKEFFTSKFFPFQEVKMDVKNDNNKKEESVTDINDIFQI
ncbi:MAG: type IV secretion system DNA-binding domain-containing protein [Acidobacteriota bacterium]